MLGPWSKPSPPPSQPTLLASFSLSFVWWWVGLAGGIILFAAVLAWHNYRRGRGDVIGASRLAALSFAASLAWWALSADHLATFYHLYQVFYEGVVRTALAHAVVLWILYMAIEPYLRRRWPQSLITWSRLLAGAFRDPLVAGQCLIGAAAGVGGALLWNLGAMAGMRIGIFPDPDPSPLLGFAGSLANSLSAGGWAVAEALVLVLFFSVLRLALRKDWIVGAVVVGLVTATRINSYPATWIVSAVTAVGAVFAIWILLRFGILPIAIAGIVVPSTPGYRTPTAFRPVRRCWT